MRYGAYAVRLCAQEAGLVLGSVLAVGEYLGYRPAVHFTWPDDDRLAAVLGLGRSDPSVLTAALVAFEAGPPARDPYCPACGSSDAHGTPAGRPCP